MALAALLVRDYDEATAFYVTKVGFDLIENTDMGGGKRWVVVRPPGSDGALLLAKALGDQAARVGDQAGGRVFLFLHTDDFAADHARMTTAGVRFLEAPPPTNPMDPWPFLRTCMATDGTSSSLRSSGECGVLGQRPDGRRVAAEAIERVH